MQKHQARYNYPYHSVYFFLFVITVSFSVVSCAPAKRMLYFNNLPKDTLLHNVVTKDFELKIRKGDVLNIGVSSLSPEASAIFTAPQASTGTGATSASGFLVDMNGNILYPKLGITHVEGLTRDELKNLLLKALPPYLKEPVITVSFVNNKVTVMGEVSAPQVLNMTSESLTLLQALVQCGGITKTAKKDNVLIIREVGSDKQFKRVNLDNSSIFMDPFYYLRPDDIVYVEPGTVKQRLTTQQLIAYITTGVSLILIILSRIK